MNLNSELCHVSRDKGKAGGQKGSRCGWLLYNDRGERCEIKQQLQSAARGIPRPFHISLTLALLQGALAAAFAHWPGRGWWLSCFQCRFRMNPGFMAFPWTSAAPRHAHCDFAQKYSRFSFEGDSQELALLLSELIIAKSALHVAAAPKLVAQS